MMIASPNRRYSGHHKDTEEEGDQGILGEEIWRKKEMWTAGYKYSWRKMEVAAQDGAGVNIFQAKMAQPPRKNNWPVCKWLWPMLQLE